jgi:hypothetical protein
MIKESACQQMAKQNSGSWFLATLILDPEDGGYIFLRNVGSITENSTFSDLPLDK